MEEKKGGGHVQEGTAGCIYGMGFIGALVFFIKTAPTFWIGVLGFFKAIFWPAFVIYKVLERLYM